MSAANPACLGGMCVVGSLCTPQFATVIGGLQQLCLMHTNDSEVYAVQAAGMCLVMITAYVDQC